MSRPSSATHEWAPCERVFISYRRDDAAAHAGRLADGLAARFGSENVFLDFESITAGEDFEYVIEDALAACQVLFVVIGRCWTALTSVRRESHARDWVGTEVAAALARPEIRVIPLLVDDAELPRADELPEDLKPLSRLNAVRLTNHRWNTEVAGLIETIRPSGPSGKTSPKGRPVVAYAVAATAVALVSAGIVLVGGTTRAHDTGTARTAAKRVPVAMALDGRCGPGVRAGINTTCPFARNVAAAFAARGATSGVVVAKSPATHKLYRMTCRRGSLSICRGGNDAVVYIRTGR